ncbi:MAG: adenylate kinase [Planctomycetes bacterium]|nr:adenylate kinase [Planctomycetota bacterium]
MKVVFLGPPGAGKGTQAQRMAKRFAVSHASTGDIFRRAMAQGLRLGLEVADYLDNGKLVPDELTSRVVAEMVIESVEDYILDGYPRTIQQARDLERMLLERGEALDGVLFFDIPEDAIIERLTGRRICAQCGANYHIVFMPPAKSGICDRCGGELRVRSDSSEQAIGKRLAEYREKTLPLVEFYDQKNLLRRVDATAEPDEVTRRTEILLRDVLMSRQTGT